MSWFRARIRLPTRPVGNSFEKSYEAKVVVKKADRTQQEIKTALDHVERISQLGDMRRINTETIDDYIAARRKERGKKGETVSPATINKELRHLRAALRKAHRWGYLPLVPDFDFEAEPTKLVRYITPEHFASLYKACGEARRPDRLPYAPASWWRALIVYCYQGTGWRISEVLALRREDLDMDVGTAVTRHNDNKGNRTEQIKLHPVVLEHLKTIPSFDSRVFPWDHDRKALDKEFHRLQGIAGIHLPCREEHEHTPACHVYGFHDLRRGFATMNAGSLSSDALQALMRHKSYATTQRYINMAPQMDKAIEALHIPEVLRQQ